MSNVSHSSNSLANRSLREEEIALICFFLSGTSLAGTNLRDSLRGSRVSDMNDGNMGSIRFVRAEPRTFGQILAEAQYTDVDGVCVSIAINADHKGDLFEVDFWRVDFSPLKRYPKPRDLQKGAISL
jgi:uncharacterized protein DUF6984